MPLPHFTKGNFAGLKAAHVNALSDAIRELQTRVTRIARKPEKHIDYFPAFIDDIQQQHAITLYAWNEAEWSPDINAWARVPERPPIIPRWSYGDGGNAFFRPAVLLTGDDGSLGADSLVLMFASRNTLGQELYYIVSSIPGTQRARITGNTLMSPFRWEYSGRRQIWNSPQRIWEDIPQPPFGEVPDEITIYNTIEMGNTATMIHPGVNLSAPGFPTGVRPLPLDNGSVVMVEPFAGGWSCCVPNAWSVSCV